MSDDTKAQTETSQIEKALTNLQIPEKYWDDLKTRDGAARVLKGLKNKVHLEALGRDEGGIRREWELIGLFFRDTGKFYQAIQVFRALYEQLILYQIEYKSWAFKSMPLIWISDMYNSLGYRAHARRYAMLCLCEHALKDRGNVSVETSGTYFRLAWIYGMIDTEIRRYAKESYDFFEKKQQEAWFPERILLELDNQWLIDVPAPQELFEYVTNPHFIEYLYQRLGSDSGASLELLAQYLLSCIAGVRTSLRKMSHSTDYDVVCSFEGTVGDFRDDLGRYVICECKDWTNKKVDFSTIAKFCRVLESAKCKTGILFSKDGISGAGKNKYAARERLKVFQDKGLAILCLELRDIEKLKRGLNLVSLLREKYESVRLDTIENIDAIERNISNSGE